MWNEKGQWEDVTLLVTLSPEDLETISGGGCYEQEVAKGLSVCVRLHNTGEKSFDCFTDSCKTVKLVPCGNTLIQCEVQDNMPDTDVD